MRLDSATVRRYRLHRDLTVEFDPSRTLITGDNETGKSTLVEAIHRALFLKATVTGSVLAEMRSHLYGSYPEVELRFTVGGDTYQLRKRFAGQQGTATLSQVGGRAWHGEEAEERLAELLGVEPTGGGRGIDKRLNAQWAHLWVWQGQGGEDPAQYTAAHNQQLLQQLQRVGGAVAMQSALDGRVAEHFAQLYDRLFTQTGKERAGSDLAAAKTAYEQARERFEQAALRLERVETAMSDFEHAEETIREAAASRDDAQRQLQAVNEKLEKLTRLRDQEQAQARELAEIQGRLAAVEETDRKIREYQDQARKLQDDAVPLHAKLADADQRLRDVRDQVDRAQKIRDEAAEKARQARRIRDLAVAYERMLDAEQQHQALALRVAEIERHEQTIRERGGRLAQLPAIDRNDLEELQERDRERGEADARLNAAAPEIELLESSLPVRIGDRPLPPGEPVRILETTELTAGDLRLRIHPGRGENLASLRARIAELGREIQEKLDRWGLPGIAEAAAVVVKRQEIQQEIDRLQAAREALNPESTRAQFQEAEQRLIAARAERDRLQLTVGDGYAVPGTLEVARHQVDEAQQRVDEAEAGEQHAAGVLETLTAELAHLTAERESVEQSLRELQRQQHEADAAIRVLVEQAGDETQRRSHLQELHEAVQTLEKRLEETRAAIAELQPDLLDADRERLERVLHNAQESIRLSEQRRAAAHALLQTDGSTDPRAEYAHARAQLAEADERRKAAQRYAAAVRLVHELFAAQQKQLAEHFSRPLAEKITTYLQPVFGPRVQAVAKFDGNDFIGVELVRPALDAALPFDALSGGTREQVAAAVRLAIAELLAADHDGTLPVVFDDAFANSDPHRIALLQRTLDLGARRGLQIIVLTCHGTSYSALGARHIELESPRATADIGPVSVTDPAQ